MTGIRASQKGKDQDWFYLTSKKVGNFSDFNTNNRKLKTAIQNSYCTDFANFHILR